MPKSAFAQALATQVVVVGGSHQELLVDTVLDQLEPADRRDAIKALLDPTVQHTTLARALAALGHKMSENAVPRWRKNPERRVARKANGDRK